MSESFSDEPALNERVGIEQIRAHFQQFPAMIVAPALGGLYTTWVLWEAVNKNYLMVGIAAVLAISATRFVLYKWHRTQEARAAAAVRWRTWMVALAFISGCAWGSMAIFLYPPQLPEYQTYLLVLLALVPVAPAAALAVYMPAFYAYYLPCVIPFVVVLGIQDGRAEKTTAVLLIMMMGATITFAQKYAAMLAEAIRLRLQLADKKEALEKAAIVKTRFLAAASHDLRQPVHALGLFLESLRSRFGSADCDGLLARIEQSRQALYHLLDAMLDISRLDAGVVEIKRKDFRLDDLLRRLHAECVPWAQKKGLRFSYVTTELLIHSDPVLLERVLRNLLSNALKYTPRGGVVLGCRRRAGRIMIQVCDTGIGISAEERQSVFQEFVQIDNSERNPNKGLGLGLSIVDRLTRLLEHPLDLRSEPGKGSIFSVEVTRAAAQPTAVSPTYAATPDELTDLGHLLYVVIDDDELVRSGMTVLLEQWGGEVIASATAEGAIDALHRHHRRPSLLLVDYRLPQNRTASDAIALCHRHIDPHTPVIIITGDTAPARIKEAHQSGYLLLHKPVEPKKLKLCIQTLLKPAVD